MDFIRRILGLSTDSDDSADDGIIVTQDTGIVSRPQEPVVQMPERSETSLSNTREQTAAADTAPLGEVEKATGELSSAGEDDNAAAVGTRPLPPLETIVPEPGQRLIFGQLSDVGMVRGNNQDSVFSMFTSGTSDDALPDFGLFVVADGMGGHQEGERASSVTTRMIARHVVQEILTPILEQRMGDSDRSPISDVLREAVRRANESVTAEIPDGGTTATAAVVLGDLVYIAHVGDSRAYMITDDGMEQVTRDHSLVQRLIELDQLTPEEAAEHPQRNVLYKAIGQSDTLEADTITRRLQPHSRLLICSDGLWNMVPEETIHNVVTQSDGPQAACNQLVKLANERGGPDNITIVLIQAPG